VQLKEEADVAVASLAATAAAAATAAGIAVAAATAAVAVVAPHGEALAPVATPPSASGDVAATTPPPAVAAVVASTAAVSADKKPRTISGLVSLSLSLLLLLRLVVCCWLLTFDGCRRRTWQICLTMSFWRTAKSNTT
jgi:hypothetical protein